MISIAYSSSAAVPFSEGDLLELLTRSRENNTAKGITGLLLFKEGKFLQVLEGDERPSGTCFRKSKKIPGTARWMSYGGK